MAKRLKKKISTPEVDCGKGAEGEEVLPGKSSGLPWRTIVQALVIAVAALWIYRPSLHGGWLWDDDFDITDNAITQSPTGLWSIWFKPGSQVDYYPIKASVQWLQWHLWGMDTRGYHLTNVGLHILSALLVWRLLSKFGLRLAWVGGLIFAIHPVQVESVAWIAELKNTLSLPPFLLAMCFWIDYEEHRRDRDGELALGLFLVAMLCKTTMVMFPVAILLYAWWKRGRVGWNDVKASAPFFLISLVLGLITVRFQHHFALQQTVGPPGGIFSRLACAGLSLSFYFSKCFLPVELMPIYPKWAVDPPSLWQFFPWLVWGGAIYGLWTKRRTWGRHALLGLGFFLLFLAPFLGFKAISYMNFTWVMDHFLYLPIIGLIGLVVAALGAMDRQLPDTLRPYGIGLVAVALALLACESHSYAKMFINQETLWTYELRYNSDAYPAHNNLGKILLEEGRLSAAGEQFEETLRIYPDYAPAHNNLGNVLRETGRLSDAMEQYRQALRINPNYAEAHYNLGNALQQTGPLPEAMQQYEQALRIQPNYAEAHNNLGNILSQTGQLPEAVEQLEQALQIKPAYAEAHNNLGNTLLLMGRNSEAIEQFNEALQIKPDETTHYNLAGALLQAGRFDDAIGQYEQALQLKPDYAEAQNNLGAALLQEGRLLEAEEHFKQALRIRPDYADARGNLARLQALQNTPPAKN